MTKNQFYFIEPSKVCMQHISMIEGYLSAISSSSMILERFELNLGVSKKTLDVLPEELVEKIKSKTIPVMNPEKRRLILKSLLELFVVMRYMFHLRANDILFVTCVLPTTFWLLEKVSHFFKKKNVHIVLHGELEGLFEEKPQSVFRLGYWCVKWMKTRRKDSYIKLVVLDDFIKEKLLNEFSGIFTNDNVSVIHHPVLPSVFKVHNPKENSKVCFIGYRTKFKGFDIFTQLAAEYPSITFLAIGGGVVENISGNSLTHLMSKNSFISEISDCAATILPYTSGYSCSLSAAALDALTAGIYIIALEQPFFRSLEAHFGSDVVTVCSTTEELRSRLSEIMSSLSPEDKVMRAERILNSKYGLKAVQKSFETLAFNTNI